jgi:hypothetical protein
MVTRLSDSVISATRTYVEPDAPYEINLNDASRSGLLAMPASPPPHPVYDAAQKEVQWLMEDSLRRWEKNAQSNAGWRRLAFYTYVGLANTCITVMVMILARIYMHGPSGRVLAACLTPWLWFAIVGVMCGLKRVGSSQLLERQMPHLVDRYTCSASASEGLLVKCLRSKVICICQCSCLRCSSSVHFSGCRCFRTNAGDKQQFPESRNIQENLKFCHVSLQKPKPINYYKIYCIMKTGLGNSATTPTMWQGNCMGKYEKNLKFLDSFSCLKIVETLIFL